MILVKSLLILLQYHVLCYSFNQRKMLSKYHNLQAKSFIDSNVDQSFEGAINAGLGTEELIYEDYDMVVYNKPTLCQTAPGFTVQDSLASRIQHKYGISRVDQMIVHRLDYATSGLVIFALNTEALKNLHTQFREHHKMYKRYVAVVDGYMNTLEGEIDLPLGRDEVNGPPLQCVRLDGKASSTQWNVLEMKNNKTYVNLIPKTGRTHQLRVHMASLGHPIVGDLFYASKSVYYQSKRLLLHAEELRIYHPRLRYAMRFYAPSPFSIDDCIPYTPDQYEPNTVIDRNTQSRMTME